ncbi:hypothetical protein PVL29_018224 [Vitis rotundifolia]|uniref:Uncharacterized protein n=1 Tax=Vitis rotundifolia TaxID=103349 RepID=A0AA39DFP8_VITRO|nr:hypothetical protein PVL29_018224 [Vitis rotundifolia]
MILVELLIGWEGPKNLESRKKQHTILLSYYAMAHEYVYWNGGRSDGGFTDGGYTAHNGPREEEWRKGAGNGHADHVCRPVIIDAMGRKRPIVCFNPISNTETYVTQTETIVFRTPAVTEWGRPSSPVHDRPPKVEQFINKIQTEVSEVPTRPGPLTAMNWRQHHNPPKAPNGTGGYGEYSDYGKDDYWSKPNSNIIIQSHPSDGDDDYYSRNDGTKEPTITNSNGWGRPKQAEWATPPGSKLTRPTSDIGAAVEILKEAAMPSSGQPVRFATPAPTVPKYTETIDSKEATRRYGNFKKTPRPDLTGGPIIDSKMAKENLQYINLLSIFSFCI